MHTLYIVGAGPGSIELLTVKALEILKEAEVLVWTDSLVSPDIISITSDNCIRIKTSNLTLEEIMPILIENCKSGKKVVRLHDGDPCLYGAITEQISCLQKEGITTQVIPGVSAYQAIAAALQTELTIPEVVQTIILSRASGLTEVPQKESLEKLASIQSSLCLYLSASHVKEVEKTLLKYYPFDTPVAIGYRVSWKDQWIKVVPLNEMGKTSKEKGLTRTTIYIISPALKPLNQRSRLYSSSHSHIFRPRK